MPKQEAQPTQLLVELEEIRDGVMVLKNGGLRRIIMVSGVNFDLKSEEEQGMIIYAYQSLLNALDFSLQFFIHSRKLNIDDYLVKLGEREAQEKNELLKSQISEYRNFINSFVSQNAIMNKSFFVTVPFDPIRVPAAAAGIAEKFMGLIRRKPPAALQQSAAEKEKQLEHSLTQLEQRTDQVLAGLRGIGLAAEPLNTEEIVELFYNLYNPEEIEKKRLAIAKQKLELEELKNIIAPPALEITPTHLKVGDKTAKTLFVFTYPRYLASGWFSPIINLPNLIDVSIFVHPVDTALALKNLRKKAAQVQAQISEAEEKGLVRNPMLETAFQDIEALRDSLQQSTEQLFNVGLYLAIYADNPDELNKLESEIVNILEGRLIYLKPAIFQQLEGFSSVLPAGNDQLLIHTPLNTSPVSSFFPFVSANLTSDEGILCGLNRHNNTLIIFDRFSLENANFVIFAKSGAGKSYAMKLETMRLLMMGTDVLIIDPENEYENLANSAGGSFFKISLTSPHHINPFDIPIIPKGEDPAEVLRSHIVNLAGLLKLMLGKMTAEQESMLDRAITETYAAHDIVPGKDFSRAQPPLLEDLQIVLENMEGGRELAERLYRFTKGSFAGFTNKATTVDIKNRLIVFSIRDLEDELRPIAMYIILNFIWNLIRAELKRRVLMIDEAWWMMKYKDGASFLFGLVKRARKYYLGVSTITQDVEDFMSSPYGRPIITNSSLQLLLKQSPAMIDIVQKTFNLTDTEKNLLLEAQVGQGLFFAGLNHVAIQIIASYLEDQIITTRPEQVLQQKP
jgi:type IV secretory pathway VirB4 component